jgi:chemotaxis methyl-accepting protein methylase
MIDQTTQAPPLEAIETVDVVGLQVTAVQTAMGVSHQVTFTSNDVANAFFTEAFDIVLFGNLLHYYADAAATDLLRRANRALHPNGIVVINTRVVDTERSRSG